MIDVRSFFDQPIKDNVKIYEYIRKISTGQEDDYTTDSDWLPTWLSLFQRKLEDVCNRFK